MSMPDPLELMLDDEALMLASDQAEMYRLQTKADLEELAKKLAEDFEFVEELAALGAGMSPVDGLVNILPDKEA